MPQWRWDQGRLQYLAFDTLKSMAPVLVGLEGSDLSAGDPLRAPLMAATGLPFAPDSVEYPVWRNYARVFKIALLATRAGDQLRTTELCQRLSRPGPDELDVQDYLGVLCQRLYFPSPAFADYSSTVTPVFPLAAILRFLIAKAEGGHTPSAGLGEIAERVEGNHMTGSEPIVRYRSLPPSTRRWTAEEERQVRELLIFASQAGLLRWEDGAVYLDVDVSDSEALKALESLATPTDPGGRLANSDQEILRLGMGPGTALSTIAHHRTEAPDDIEFTEGRRVRSTHLRIERSARLRRAFLASLASPILCDMCGLDTSHRYPWTDHVVEVHHVMPLGSGLSLESRGVSLAHLVAVCPTCHKGVHLFYRDWLTRNGREDFASIAEAQAAYQASKSAIILS